MAITSPSSIGVIACSTRKPRVCPQIVSFVLDTVKTSPLTSESISFSVIDLADWNLPIFDESVVPSHVKSPSGYDHEHTRQWSAEISRHNAFIFVTPQYNWGYPASIKNAIDYLFNEWVGKPSMIVSYGGHGGGKAAAQLYQVLQGLRMRPVDPMPALAFGSMDVGKKAFAGEQLDTSIWNSDKEMIVKAFAQLLELLEVERRN